MTEYPAHVRLHDATLTRSHKIANAGYDLAVNGVVVAWVSDSQYDECQHECEE